MIHPGGVGMQLSLARLRAQVSELGGTVAEEDRGIPPKRQETRKPTATDDDSEFVRTRSARRGAAAVHHLCCALPPDTG